MNCALFHPFTQDPKTGKPQTHLDMLRHIYEPFSAPILVTDIESAELIKHAANSFLALKISYINAVAAVCDASGADVEKVAEGVFIRVALPTDDLIEE